MNISAEFAWEGRRNGWGKTLLCVTHTECLFISQQHKKSKSWLLCRPINLKLRIFQAEGVAGICVKAFVFVERFNSIKTKLEIVSEVGTFPGVAVKWKYILLWNSINFFLTVFCTNIWTSSMRSVSSQQLLSCAAEHSRSQLQVLTVGFHCTEGTQPVILHTHSPLEKRAWDAEAEFPGVN